MLSPSDMVMALLVREDGAGHRMPTTTVRELPLVLGRLDNRIDTVKVFASPSNRTGDGRGGQAPDSLMARAIGQIKQAAPDLTVITETCLCSYTRTGDCHLTRADGSIDLPATIEAIAGQAVTQAVAGADIVGPAGMVPGAVPACRRALDQAGYDRTRIMPHLIITSSLYAGYREAMNAAPASGQRAFQLPPAAAARAIRMGLRMLATGADALLLEPALFCADILTGLRAATAAALLPFSVSGEYLNLSSEILVEEYTMLRRAGATQIITYAADTLSNDLPTTRTRTSIR